MDTCNHKDINGLFPKKIILPKMIEIYNTFSKLKF